MKSRLAEVKAKLATEIKVNVLNIDIWRPQFVHIVGPKRLWQPATSVCFPFFIMPSSNRSGNRLIEWQLYFMRFEVDSIFFQVRHDVENELKAMRKGLLSKKIHTNLTFRRINHYEELARLPRGGPRRTFRKYWIWQATLVWSKTVSERFRLGLDWWFFGMVQFIW